MPLKRLGVFVNVTRGSVAAAPPSVPLSTTNRVPARESVSKLTLVRPDALLASQIVPAWPLGCRLPPMENVELPDAAALTMSMPPPRFTGTVLPDTVTAAVPPAERSIVSLPPARLMPFVVPPIRVVAEAELTSVRPFP